MTAEARAPRQLHPSITWAGLTLALAAVLVALLMLFILPSLHSGPRNLAVGVIGDPAVVAGVGEALEQQSPGGFELREYGSGDDLARAIRDREIAGGLDLDSTTVQVSVASAGSTAVSGTIDAVGNAVARTRRYGH